MVEHVWEGYNSCCFAYGQTGSGKTYSIFGEESGLHKGFVPRVVEQIFDMRWSEEEGAGVLGGLGKVDGKTIFF